MLSTIVFYIVRLLILDPFQTEITDRLTKANVPYEVIANVRICAAGAGRLIADRAENNPGALLSMVFDIWVRDTAPDRILTAVEPACGPAIETAKAFLSEQSA